MANSNSNSPTQPDNRPEVSSQQITAQSPLRLRNSNAHKGPLKSISLVRPSSSKSIRSHRIFCLILFIIIPLFLPIFIVRRNQISRSKAIAELFNQHPTYRPYNYDITPPPSKPAPVISKIPICQPPLILTLPYHGSSWFADMASGCMFSKKNPRKSRKFQIAMQQLEMWNPNHQGPHANYESMMASTVLQKHALKIFPAAFYSNRDRIKKLMTLLPQNTPVVFLKRQPDEAFARLTKITTRHQTDANSDENLMSHKKFKKYQHQVYTFFDQSTELMKETQRKFDVVKYESLRSHNRILLRRQNCYIANCNFKQGAST